MNIARLLTATAITIFGIACSSDSSKPAALPGSTVPEVFLYVANVDNLRLREAPNQTSTVIAQVKEGAVLEGTGNKSKTKVEIELRGISHLSPFYEVTSLDGNKPTGWAFGGALISVYSGSRSGCPDASRVGQYAGFLKSLDTKDLNSGRKAWSYVENDLADASRPLADAAFIMLDRFLRRMEAEGEFYKLTEKLAFTADDGRDIFSDHFNHDKYPVTAQLAANGFRMVMGEGMLFPVVNWGRFQEYFSPRTTQAMQKFINQRTAQQNAPMFDEGELLIPMEKVADVAIFWEKFNRENPHFPLGEETQESESWLRQMLTSGSDSTPVFSGENGTVGENYRSVWDYIQQLYPNTQLAKKTKEMADLCASEGWKRTKKVEDFILKSVQPPAE